jgi:hypothetical protein
LNQVLQINVHNFDPRISRKLLFYYLEVCRLPEAEHDGWLDREMLGTLEMCRNGEILAEVECTIIGYLLAT